MPSARQGHHFVHVRREQFIAGSHIGEEQVEQPFAIRILNTHRPMSRVVLRSSHQFLRHRDGVHPRFSYVGAVGPFRVPMKVAAGSQVKMETGHMRDPIGGGTLAHCLRVRRLDSGLSPYMYYYVLTI